MKQSIKIILGLLILSNLSLVKVKPKPNLVQKLIYSLNERKRVEELITSFATLEKGRNPNKIEGYDYVDFLSLEIKLTSLQSGTYVTDEKTPSFFR